MRHNEPITTYPITKPVDTGIHFDIQLPGCVPEYESWAAGISTNCDMERWMRPGAYTTRFKATIIAWYRLHRAVGTHAVDAQNIAMKSRMNS